MAIILPGQMLGPYRIVSQIGLGGMATVYKAYHAEMERYVAIKVLPFEFSSSKEFLQRFKQEAKIIARLEHPHILPVYDFGESNGTPYLVMRYFESGTLNERLNESPMSLDEIDRVFTQLADALQYAHEHGVVHRDIKPSNALLDARGNVCLTDFGVAKLVEGSAKLTATGAVTGTPAYMSPEQAQGEKTDFRSDIYSLGIVLYEMVTGHVPYEAETPLAILFKHVQDPLPPPSSLKPDVHPAVEAVILKALSKEPQARYGSASAFLAGWQSAMAEVKTPSAVPDHARPTLLINPVTPLNGEAQPLDDTDYNKISAAHEAITAPIRERIILTVKKSRPLKWIIASMLAILMVGLILLAGAGLAASRLTPMTASNPPAQKSLTTSAPKPIPVPDIAGQLPTAAPLPQGWVSWTPANAIADMVVQGHHLYAAGPGGVTVWNLDNGEFRHLTTRNGLPGNNVTVVFADEDGSLWFGTDSGLVHFTGAEWQVFTVDDGLDSNFITSIGRFGDLLLVGTNYTGTDGSGLISFDGQDWHAVEGFPSTYEELPDTLSSSVSKIITDGKGNAWVGTWHGLGQFQLETRTWKVFHEKDGLPPGPVQALAWSDALGLLVGTDSGLAVLENDHFEPLAGISPDELGISTIRKILPDSRGQIWVAGDGGIASYDPGSQKVNRYNRDNEKIEAYSLTAAAEDDLGRLYFGSEDRGIIRLSDEIDYWQVPDTITFPWVRRILPAPGDHLWFIFEWGSSYCQISLKNRQISFHPNDDPCCPQPMSWDTKGRLWSGGEGGLWITGEDEKIHLTRADGLPSDVVTTVAIDKTGLGYVGTDNGLAIIDNQSVIARFNKDNAGFISNRVTTIFIASDDSLWVGTEYGVSRRPPYSGWVHYKAARDFVDYMEKATDFAEDKNKVLWLSTYGAGVYRFVDGRWHQIIKDRPESKLPGPMVSSIATAPDGSLWFGMQEEGAARFDGNRWTNFRTADGLINPFVNDIYIEKDGTVWFATSGGISQYKSP